MNPNKASSARRVPRKSSGRRAGGSAARSPTPQQSPERLQKLLAGMGLGSRRQIEQWIAAGDITVNGHVAKLGEQATPADDIRLRGRRLEFAANRRHGPRLLMYHKPVGEVCTRNDPEGRRTIFASLPRKGRLLSVGRLDLNTSGLLLLTDDGELVNRLTHPSHEIARVYAVRVLGDVPQATLTRLTTGVALEDGSARFDAVEPAGGSGANQWFHVRLHEGRQREVRRLWESQGVQVSRLIRIGFGPLQLDRDLPSGRFRDLQPAEVQALYEAVELAPPKPWQTSPAPKGKPRRFKSGPRQTQ